MPKFKDIKRAKDNWQLAASCFGQYAEQTKGFFLIYRKLVDEYTAVTHVRPTVYTLGPIKYPASPDWIKD